MPVNYKSLKKMLIDKDMEMNDLLKIISRPTLNKLNDGKPVNGTTLDKICSFLKCQPGEIMEYKEDNKKPNK